MFKLADRPENLRGEYFDNLFRAADTANMTAKEHEAYILAMASERDIRNQIRYGRIQGHREGHKEGLEKGIEQGLQQGLEKGIQQGKAELKLETAKKFKAAGVDLTIIAECTGLDIETITAL